MLRPLGILTAFTNIVSDKKTTPATKAKVVGYLRRLMECRFICRMVSYLEILELITPVSKMMEKERILPVDINYIVQEALIAIRDVPAEEGGNGLKSEILHIEDGNMTLTLSCAADNHKATEDRQKKVISLTTDYNIKVNEEVIAQVREEKNDILRNLGDIIENKFEDFRKPIF